MELKVILNNKNWRRAQYIEDEDGFVVFDETEGYAWDDVRKFITLDGERYQFVKIPHGFFARLYYNIRAQVVSLI